MSRAAYLMARLTVKGIQPGMSFGGIPELTKTDIAACCGGLPSLTFHLMLAKYCDDVHAALQAVGEMQELACKKSAPIAEMDPVSRLDLCAYLVNDFVSAHRCKRCKGTARQIEDSKIISCKRCQGSGKEQASGRKRAQSINVPESTWRDSGLNRECEFMERYLYDLEIAALERIARRAS